MRSSWVRSYREPSVGPRLLLALVLGVVLGIVVTASATGGTGRAISSLAVLSTPTPTPVPSDPFWVVRAKKPAAPTGPRHIGIQAGHWQTDTVPEELANLRVLGGAVWSNITEQDYVLGIAQKVVAKLQAKGYVVDLLPTTIPAGYVADAFVAIHADGDETGTARGFKIAHGDRRTPYDEALLQVLAEEYWKSTDLPVDPNLTPGMLEYYAWRWERFQTTVSPYTPAVIIETGFISSAADRAVLFLHPDKVVDGIVNGVERFLREVPRDAVFRDDLVFPRATPAPSTP